MAKRIGVFSEDDAKKIAAFVGQKPARLNRNTRRTIGRFTKIPVELTQVGGSDGDADNQATWTYSVTNMLTGQTIYDSGSAINPISSPHKCTRPPKGKMQVATAGEGIWRPDGAGDHEFVLTDFNEQPNSKKCS